MEMRQGPGSEGRNLNKILIRILWTVSLQNVNVLTSKEKDSRQLPQSHLLEKTRSWGWDKMLGVWTLAGLEIMEKD